MVIDLSRLDGSNGFRIDGVHAFDFSGKSVAGAGDVNDDGIADLIVGARGDGNGYAAYVVFGAVGGFGARFEIKALDGDNGFRLEGGFTGQSVAGAGDINGDGIDDLIVGAPEFGVGVPGKSYVVFGSSDGFATIVDLEKLNGGNGFVVNGIDIGDYCGKSVSGAGDINGDGVDDLIVGAPRADLPGESYVVFGSLRGFAASLDLANLNGVNGFRLDGVEAYSQSGWSVAGAGDVNGDGIDDLIIGANAGRPGAGFVVFGSAAGFDANLDLAALDGATGFRINGIDGDTSGYSVAGAGDIDGDGIDDLIIGAPERYGTGKSYVVFGSVAGFAADLGLAELDGSNGFELRGGPGLGCSVAGAGDVNGDGIDDLIIGDRRVAIYAGQSHVVFGSKSGFPASIDLATLAGDEGFRLDGRDTYDSSGSSVAGAGDVNGDGIDDLIIGAPGVGDAAGRSYVVFGTDPTIVGGPGRDELQGRPTADRIYGRLENDRLTGRGGDDKLYGANGLDKLWGGAGDDKLFGDNSRDRLRGGGDDDWLRGGDGGDELDGGGGRDRLLGGKGDDLLVGGAADDTFVFYGLFGSDSIDDFDADPRGSEDRIDLRRLDVTEASFERDVTILDLGDDISVVVGSGAILLRGVSGDGANVIDSADFILAM